MPPSLHQWMSFSDTASFFHRVISAVGEHQCCTRQLKRTVAQKLNNIITNIMQAYFFRKEQPVLQMLILQKKICTGLQCKNAEPKYMNSLRTCPVDFIYMCIYIY